MNAELKAIESTWNAGGGIKPEHVDWLISQLKAAQEENKRLRNNWQPIETAPKDGTVILVLKKSIMNDGGGIFMASYGKLDDWQVWDWRIKQYPQGTWDSVTHWQPLPQPPTT